MADWMQSLDIGCSGDEPWDEMHRAGQYLVCFTVQFARADGQVRIDYRRKLESMWGSLLSECGLSASILYSSFHPERGPGPSVTGFVWRQNGRESIESLTDEEIERLRDILLHSGEPGLLFTLMKMVSGEVRGGMKKVKRYKFGNGGYSEEGFWG